MTVAQRLSANWEHHQMPYHLDREWRMAGSAQVRQAQRLARQITRGVLPPSLRLAYLLSTIQAFRLVWVVRFRQPVNLSSNLVQRVMQLRAFLIRDLSTNPVHFQWMSLRPL